MTPTVLIVDDHPSFRAHRAGAARGGGVRGRRRGGGRRVRASRRRPAPSRGRPARRAAPRHRRVRGGARGCARERRLARRRADLEPRRRPTSARSSTAAGARGFVPKAELSGAALAAPASMRVAEQALDRALAARPGRRERSTIVDRRHERARGPDRGQHRTRAADRLVVHGRGPRRLGAPTGEPDRPAHGRRRAACGSASRSSWTNSSALFTHRVGARCAAARRVRPPARRVPERPPRDEAGAGARLPRVSRRGARRT